jgi:hypothetical protein
MSLHLLVVPGVSTSKEGSQDRLEEVLCKAKYGGEAGKVGYKKRQDLVIGKLFLGYGWSWVLSYIRTDVCTLCSLLAQGSFNVVDVAIFPITNENN